MLTLIIDGNPDGWLTQKLVHAACDRLEALGGRYLVIDSTCSRPHAMNALIKAERVIVISPIYWSRLPGKLETMLDEILVPTKVFKFMDIPWLTKRFGIKYSKGLTNIKRIDWVLSYGSPRIAMIGMPFFRLGFLLSRLILGIRSVKHWPTYLCEGDQGLKRRIKVINRLSKII